MRFGAAVDRLVFGVGDDIVIKTARGEKEQPGQILVTEKELERANQVARSIQASGAFRSATDAELRLPPSVQSKLAWFDSELLLHLVSKPDYLCPIQRTGKDLKTAWNVSDYAITRDIEQYGYDIQANAYLDAMENCLGWTQPGFCFVFAQSSAPYTVIIRHLDSDELERGRQLWQEAKVTWKRCLETGVWPDQPIETKTKTKQQRLTEWENT
jgi:hypothetical protein